MAKYFKHISISRLNFYLAILLAFIIPINRIVSTYIIVFWTITWIIERIKKTPYSVIDKKHKTILFSLIAFYILHIIGLLYTSNIHNGLIDLRIKLPLLVFPILLLFQNHYYKKFYQLILSGFIAGTILTLLFLYVRAFYYYPSLHKTAFLYTHFSYVFHPSYLSMYVIFSLISLIFIYESFLYRKYLLPVILVSLFFLGSIYCLASKANFISAFFISIIYVTVKLFKRSKIWFLVLTGIIIIGSYFSIQNNYRYFDFFHLSMNTFHKVSKDTKSTTIVRIYVFKTALELIKENPLGYGTGDVKDELMKKYAEDGINGALEEKLNSHNQYFETTIGLGIIGLAILLYIILYSLILGIRHKNFLIYLFIVLIAFNFFTESMLNRQDGVGFIVFSLTLLISTLKTNKSILSS